MPSGRTDAGPLTFVVHKHKARALHYDLRLESRGKMPSWAVPKGPTLDPSKKRLAMSSGDHELGYQTFEGVLPAERPGEGAVMIWDRGTYSPEIEGPDGRREVRGREAAEAAAEAGLKSGMLKFVLYGQRLQGSFALVKTRGLGEGSWLLIKHKDSHCVEGYDANSVPTSAVTGLGFEEISSGAATGAGSPHGMQAQRTHRFSDGAPPDPSVFERD
jgi:bifunctional non-homologous end joining protein LigD